MWIFSRYVVWEVLKVFGLALTILTLMTTLGMGVKEGLNKGLPPEVIATTLPFMMPEMLGITIPIAILLAVTSVFGRMAGANEIVALKSAGISPMQIMWPVLLLAFLLSLFTVSMYEVAATWCRPSVRRIVTESIEQIAYGVLRAERSFRSPKFSIAVARVDGRRLLRPVITLHPREDTPPVTLTAEEAELRSDRDAGGLVILCRNGEVEVEGKMRLSFPDTEQHTVPFDPPKRPVHRDWLATSEIPGCIAELHKKINEVKQEKAGVAAKEASALDKQIADLQWRVHRLASEPYRRWSNGFSCLCFVLIGAPVAMRWRFDSFLSSFFVCFLPILGVYYPLLMFQEDLATSGTLPPYAFWLGNIALVGPGVWLLRRVIRY